MKISRQYLLWSAAVVMFCAAVSLGCGGSSNNDNTASTDGTDGRNINGWEDLTFEEFSGAWEIVSITMGMGSGIQLYPLGLGVNRFKFTADASSGNLALATLDGREGTYFRCTFSDDLGHSANNIVVLSCGTYSATNLDNVYRQDINNGQRRNNYLLQGYGDGYTLSFP